MRLQVPNHHAVRTCERFETTAQRTAQCCTATSRLYCQRATIARVNDGPLILHWQLPVQGRRIFAWNASRAGPSAIVFEVSAPAYSINTPLQVHAQPLRENAGSAMSYDVSMSGTVRSSSPLSLSSFGGPLLFVFVQNGEGRAESSFKNWRAVKSFYAALSAL